MGSIGQSLREARKSRGMSLEDVSKATKVRVEYLAALEGDDFESLPDDVFSRGFVHVFAEVVGLDPEAVVQASAAERKARGSQEPGQVKELLAELDRLIPDKAGRRSSRRRLLLGAGAILCVGVVGLASWWIVGRSTREPVAPTSAPVLEPPSHAVQPPTPPATRQTAPTPPPAVPSPAVDVPARPPDAALGPSLTVPEFAVGRGVANRRIVEPGDSFAEGQTVWFWTHVQGAGPGDRIRHVWLHGGQQVHAIDLELGGASWRTHSSKRMLPGSTGDWRVEARDASGRVLAASDFVCH